MQYGRWAAERAPQTGLVRGCKVRVYWPVDDPWYPGTVDDTGADSLTHVAYDDEDEEDLDMSKEKYKVISAAVQEVSGWDAALQERWREELWDSSLTELAVQAADEAGEEQAVRTWLPARHVPAVHAHRLGLEPVTPPQWCPTKEKGGRRVHLKRRLAIPAAGVQGLAQLVRQWRRWVGELYGLLELFIAAASLVEVHSAADPF
ncbi:hypothetical protein CYMTET_44255 [Cymbomonas tetramitiformis]|uniref:Uncharacterized protein n=1 Tax=Cymbomonas tetramitiformis TaxID=36881 RepID=A0AAE0EZU0_9CHLO|nr:hypothetical protein CYMTET_44255 [Cymbomonas tetramitiformis]